MTVTRERVAEQLKALRQLHGAPDKLLPQDKAAQRAGVGYREWQRWEAKEVTPKTESLSKVAEAYSIPLDTFDDGSGPERSSTPLADRLQEIDDRLDGLEAMLSDIHGAIVAATEAPTPAEAVRKAAAAVRRTRKARDAARRAPAVADGQGRGGKRPTR